VIVVAAIILQLLATAHRGNTKAQVPERSCNLQCSLAGYSPFVKLAEQCVRSAQKRAHRAVAAVVVQSASQCLSLSQTLQHLTYFVKLDQHATHLQTDLEPLLKD